MVRATAIRRGFELYDCLVVVSRGLTPAVRRHVVERHGAVRLSRRDFLHFLIL